MELHYHCGGSGPPLLLLHGLLGSHQNLLPLATILEQEYTVYVLDQRNHGDSPHAAELNYEVLAADLSDFIQQHQLDRAHVLGHSMGGKVAMRFAQRYPQLLQKLIVVDMSPRAQPARYDYILNALRALDLSRCQHRGDADQLLTAAIPDKSIRQFQLKNLGRDATDRLIWKPNIPVIHENYARLREGLAQTPSFAGPTLFLRGGRSDYVPDSDWPLIQTTFPNARLETIPEAGHWVHAEAFEPFMRVVQKFLRQP